MSIKQHSQETDAAPPDVVYNQMAMLIVNDRVDHTSLNEVKETARRANLVELAEWLSDHATDSSNSLDTLLEVTKKRHKTILVNFSSLPFSIEEFYEFLGVSGSHIRAEGDPSILDYLNQNQRSVNDSLSLETLADALKQYTEAEISETNPAHCIYMDIVGEIEDRPTAALETIAKESQYTTGTQKGKMMQWDEDTLGTVSSHSDLDSIPGISVNPLGK